VTYEVIGWYASILFGLFFSGIGLPPVPEEAGILYAAGLTALHPEVRWWLAWPLAGLGILGADAVLYGIGRAAGPRIFRFRVTRRVISPERRQRIERKFAASGIKILLLARLLPPLRTGVFIIAGAIRFPVLKFLIADLVYAVFGVGILFFAGQWVIAGIEWVTDQFTAWTGLPAKVLVWGLAAAVGAWLLFKFYRVLQHREERGDVAPPLVLGMPQVAEAVKAGANAVEEVAPGPAPEPQKAEASH
jgi:membrane protein DedA with SNARE-associated domain